MSLAAAVEALGGTSKLTAAELEKVGKKAAEAVEKAKALGVDVPPELQKLADANKQTSSSFDVGAASLTKWAVGLVSVTAAIELAKAGFSAVIGFLKDSVTAAAGAEAAQAQLTATMASHGVAVPEVIAAYQGYISVLAKTTTQSDDALTASAALLTTMGVMPREMNAALTAATNLAERFGGGEQGLAKATEAVGKAAMGQTASLAKAGIQLDDTKVKAEGFQYVVTQVNEQLGGAAVAAANTYAGRLAQLANAWDEVQESVGLAIVQNQTVITTINALSNALTGANGDLAANRSITLLVSDATILLVKAVGLLADMFGAVVVPIRETFKEFAAISDGAAKVVGAMLTIEKGLLAIGSGSEEAVRNLEALKAHHEADAAAMRGHAAAADTLIGFTKGLSAQAAGLATELKATRGQTVELTEATHQNADAANLSTKNHAGLEDQHKKNAAEAKKLAAAYQALQAEIRALEGPQTRFATGLAGATDTASELDDWKAFQQAMGDLEGAGAQAGKGLETVGTHTSDVKEQFKAAEEQTKKYEDSLKDLADALDNVGDTVGGSAGEVFKWGATVVTSMHAAKQSGAAMKGGFQQLTAAGDQSFEELATGATNLAAGALSAVSAIDAATNSASTSMSVLGGVAAGAQAGMAFGPWGAAVGAAAGAVVGFAKSARDGRNAVTEFIDASGGSEVMRQRLAELGAEGERLWVSLTQGVDAGDLDQAKAVIAEVQAAMGNQAAAFEGVNEAAQRYGFTLKELGPALAKGELDKQAAQLYKDFELLTAAGVKSTTVTKKMAEAMNKYLKDAHKMGVEVPSAMRPMLEQMAKMGVLTDSSGKKIKDVEKSGIKFALTMSEGFEKLIDSVQQLTQVIAGSLGVQLEKTKDRVNAIPDRINIKVNYDEGDRPKALKSGTVSVKGYQGGTKGFEDFGAGTLVMLHGREAVVPESAVKSGGGGRSVAASAGVTIVINAQGAFFDTPGDLQRLADKVNAALTAKHGLTNRRRAA